MNPRADRPAGRVTAECSVIVPTYRRPEALRALVAALTLQDYPASRFEVILVDDGGGIPLGPAVDEFRVGLNLSLMTQANAGPGAARNLGASRASGRYLAFTDNDCLPDPGWLSAFARGFEDSPSAVLGGKTYNVLSDNIYAAATQLVFDYLYDHYSPTQVLGGFFTANNLAVPREAFLDAGGFDPALRFGEDRDFCYRWACCGGRFAAAPQAVVRHAHALNLATFLGLHCRYGGGTAHFWNRTKERGLPRVKLSPPSWYLNLVLQGIRYGPGLHGLGLSALIAAAQAAVAIGLFRGALVAQRREIDGFLNENP